MRRMVIQWVNGSVLLATRCVLFDLEYLVPVNMIACKQYDSVNPVGIIALAIVSTVVAVVYCKMKDKKKRRV